VVLLPGEHVKSGLDLFTEALGPIVACSDFEIETANIAAIVLILDPKVGNGNFVIHHFEVLSYRGSLSGRILKRAW
jgi:hypothetical protein